MKMDRAYIEPLYLLLCPFKEFCVLNVVISLSDWTPNVEIFGIQKSPVKPKLPPNISSPEI